MLIKKFSFDYNLPAKYHINSFVLEFSLFYIININVSFRIALQTRLRGDFQIELFTKFLQNVNLTQSQFHNSAFIDIVLILFVQQSHETTD